MLQKELRSVISEIRVQRAADGAKTISGLIPYNTRSVDLGGFKEIIAPGAFTRALSPDADIYAFRQHNADVVLGRTKSGTMTLADSDDGLRYNIILPNTSEANDLAELIERGDIDGCSFGFISPTSKDQRWEDTSDGVVRTLLNVDMYEISPCVGPAYPDSKVSVRSCPPELRSKLHSDEPVEDTPSEEIEELASSTAEVDESDSIRTYMHMLLTLRQRQ